MAGAELQQAGKLVVQVGAGEAAIAIAGATAGAVSAATVIAATGDAAAVVLVGYGAYKLLSSKGGKW